MRELNSMEVQMMVCGGTVAEFNSCMAENWAENTTTSAVGGAIAGAFFGPGAVLGGIVGAIGGSTGTAVYCAGSAIF